jgi:hypothetical protein
MSSIVYSSWRWGGVDKVGGGGEGWIKAGLCCTSCIVMLYITHSYAVHHA